MPTSRQTTATLQLNNSSADTLTITINDGAGGIDTHTITGYNANNTGFSGGNNSFSFPGNNVFNVNTTSFDTGGGNDTIVTAWNHSTRPQRPTPAAPETTRSRPSSAPISSTTILNSSLSTVRNFYDGSPNSGMNLAGTSWHAIVSTDWETAKLRPCRSPRAGQFHCAGHLVGSHWNGQPGCDQWDSQRDFHRHVRQRHHRRRCRRPDTERWRRKRCTRGIPYRPQHAQRRRRQ